MKTIGLMAMVLVLEGCVAAGGTRSGNPSAGDPLLHARANAFAQDPFPPDNSPSAKSPDLSPHLILPVDGSLPVIGIPLGGNIYQPVTGGPPVIGLPLGN